MKYKKGFTFIELLLAINLSLIASFALVSIITLSQRVITKHIYYSKRLSDSQFIYWYMYNQINENIGIHGFNEALLDNFKQSKNTINWDSLFISRLNFNETSKVTIINSMQLGELFASSKHYSNILDNIPVNSSILKINHQKFKKNKVENFSNIFFVSCMNTVSPNEFLRSNKLSCSLNQYSENRVEELIKEVELFNVQEVYGKFHKYFKFRFKFSIDETAVNRFFQNNILEFVV